jgi:Zn-finger protein
MIKLKKVLLWLKHYWYFPVVFIALAAAFVFHRKKVEMLANLLMGSIESHAKEVEAIESSEAKKAQKIEDAAIIHSDELQEIISDEVGELETAGKEKEEREKSLQELEMEMLAEEMKKAFKKEG